MRKVTKIWTCKDERRVRICDMTDSHLLNAARMLKRKIDEFGEMANPFLGLPPLGEMAMMAWENECAAWTGGWDDDGGNGLLYRVHHPLYQPLLNEIERRGLKM